MSPDSIAGRINAILFEEFDLDRGSLLPGARLVRDLGFDSLDITELSLSIEEVFHLRIPDADAQRWDSLQDVADYVAARLPQEAAS